MANGKTSLFPLPQTQVVESYTVQLVTGETVTRTPDQLVVVPAGITLPATSAPANS